MADNTQATYDALNAQLAEATAAANNPASTQAERDVAFAKRTEIAAKLDDLDIDPS
jgi:hypothetical protein